jgi:hypothetical protein
MQAESHVPCDFNHSPSAKLSPDQRKLTPAIGGEQIFSDIECTINKSTMAM